MPEPDYQGTEYYLQTVFALLEGGATLEEARRQLSEYLQWHRSHGLPAAFEEFLIGLYFEKCRKSFEEPSPGPEGVSRLD